MSSPQAWHELDGAEVNLVIIGGGITGAGSLWDAGLRGISSVLFDMGDFGCGTSSRSSKLIHGGLRYLQQGDLKLIYESVNERRRLRSLARHLVRPLGFYFPRYRGQFPGVATMSMGLFIYEALTGFRVDKLHRRMSASETAQAIPGISQTDLSGCLFYYDAKAADARVVWECILGARQAGAGAFNYTKVVGAEHRHGHWHISVENLASGETASIKAKAVIAAVGPWGNTALKPFFSELPDNVRPTKGVHLVLPASKLPVSDAVTLQHPRDKRVTFVIPGRGYVYTGTTDTDYQGDLAEPEVTTDDADYLLENLNHFFPDHKFGHDDVTASWAGLRPLIQEAGKSAYQVSREHQINEIKTGFFTVEGGKLTTFRIMAKQAVDAAVARIAPNAKNAFDPCITRSEPLPGGRGIFTDDDLDELVRRTAGYLKCGDACAHHLVYHFGTRCIELLPYIESEPDRAITGLPHTWGEIQYMLENESIVELEDLFLRRSEIYYQAADNGLQIAEAVAARMQKLNGLGDDWRHAAVARYRQRCQRGLAFKKNRG